MGYRSFENQELEIDIYGASWANLISLPFIEDVWECGCSDQFNRIYRSEIFYSIKFLHSNQTLVIFKNKLTVLKMQYVYRSPWIIIIRW